jgi:RNA polymerase sigma-70 factor (ECF subfamily)
MGIATPKSLLERLANQPTEEDWYSFHLLYRDFIWRIIQSQGVPHHDAEDLSQDVLLVVTKAVPSYRHNGQTGAFRSWLRQIVWNRLRPYWLAQARKPLADEGVLALLEEKESLLTDFIEKEHVGSVVQKATEQIKARVNESTWQAYHRVKVLGKLVAQVAQELGLSENAVTVACSRVRAHYKEICKHMLDDG